MSEILSSLDLKSPACNNAEGRIFQFIWQDFSPEKVREILVIDPRDNSYQYYQGIQKSAPYGEPTFLILTGPLAGGIGASASYLGTFRSYFDYRVDPNLTEVDPIIFLRFMRQYVELNYESPEVHGLVKAYAVKHNIDENLALFRLTVEKLGQQYPGLNRRQMRNNGRNNWRLTTTQEEVIPMELLDAGLTSGDQEFKNDFIKIVLAYTVGGSCFALGLLRIWESYLTYIDGDLSLSTGEPMVGMGMTLGGVILWHLIRKFGEES